jgi:RAT1-interacting protein
MQPRHRQQTYYGYSFESYCTSESPTQGHPTRNRNVPKGWGGDVNTNVQWCSVVRTKLGNTRLVIGGEVDCIRGWCHIFVTRPLLTSKKGKYTHQPNNFVELKTSITIRPNNDSDASKFERFDIFNPIIHLKVIGLDQETSEILFPIILAWSPCEWRCSSLLFRKP